MRAAPGTLRAAMARESMTLCRLVTLTLRNGAVYHFTDGASVIDYNGTLYLPGAQVSAIRQNEDGPVGNATLEILYTQGVLVEEDTRRGYLDGSTFALEVVDYADLNAGSMPLMKGRTQQIVTSDRSSVVLEVGPYDNGTLVLGENYSQRCRNVFGDKRCKVNKAALAVEFTVTSVGESGLSFRTDVPLGEGEEGRTDNVAGEAYFLTPGIAEWIVPDCDLVTFDLTSGGGGAGESADNSGDYYSLSGGVLYGQNGENGQAARIARTTAALEQDSLTGEAVAVVMGGTAGQGASVRGQRAAWTWAELNIGPYFGGIPASINPVFTPFQGAPGGKGRPRISAAFTDPRFTAGGLSFNSAGQDGSNGHTLRLSLSVGTPGGLVVGERLYVRVPGKARGGGMDGAVPAGSTPAGAFPQVPGSPSPPPAGPAVDGEPGGEGAAGAVRITWAGTRVLEAKNYVVGTIRWLTGLNVGTVAGVAANSTGEIILTSGTRNPIQVGDKGKIEPGCTNYADMCEARYNNLKNMQAEPVVPQGIGNAPTPESVSVADPQRPAQVDVQDYPPGGLIFFPASR